jgi:hypothetical protein
MEITISDMEEAVKEVMQNAKLFSLRHVPNTQCEHLLLTTEEKRSILLSREYRVLDQYNYNSLIEEIAKYDKEHVRWNNAFKTNLERGHLPLWDLLLYHNQSGFAYTHYAYRVPGIQTQERKNFLFLNSQPHEYSDYLQAFLANLSMEGFAGSLVCSTRTREAAWVLETCQIDAIYHHDPGSYGMRQEKSDVFWELITSSARFDDPLFMDYLQSVPMNNASADIDSFFYSFEKSKNTVRLPKEKVA